jgi:Family of unknown function (DUF6152)
MKLVILGSLLAAAGLFAAPHTALAHHGVATYDMKNTIVLQGVVTSFKFINPHAEIYFDVKDDKGGGQHWIGEMTTPNMLARRGWNKEVLKPGDQLTITGNRSKDGSTSMRVQKVVFPDGRELDPNGNDF